MSEPWDSGWRWWARLGTIGLTSVLACGLIVFGGARFLDQAQREHDRVECIREQVQVQAEGNATMAAGVLDTRRTQAERADAVRAWADRQVAVAEQLRRC